jgi:hypothetical protein
MFYLIARTHWTPHCRTSAQLRIPRSIDAMEFSARATATTSIDRAYATGWRLRTARAVLLLLRTFGQLCSMTYKSEGSSASVIRREENCWQEGRLVPAMAKI